MVLAFMAMVAVFVSERVLSRLASAQTHHLEDLAAVHLDGLATALIDPVIRDDTWEVFDILDRARQSHAGLKPTSTVVATADGEVLASSDPRAIPSRSPAARLFPDPGRRRRPRSPCASTRAAPSPGATSRAAGRWSGRSMLCFDIAPLLAERRSVLWTLLATNAALTLALALLAWLTVRRMMRPVGILAAHLQGRRGRADLGPRR